MRWAGIYLLRILGGRDEFYAAGKIPCGRAASYFLFSLRLLPPYTELSQQHASIIAERISAVVYTFGGHALGMSLVTLDFPRVMYRNVVCYGNLRKYDTH